MEKQAIDLENIAVNQISNTEICPEQEKNTQNSVISS
jgi:hypothetical protein